jgi:hypothetical protein
MLNQNSVQILSPQLGIPCSYLTIDFLKVVGRTDFTEWGDVLAADVTVVNAQFTLPLFEIFEWRWNMPRLLQVIKFSIINRILIMLLST